MKTTARDRVFRARMSEAEVSMIRALAELEGVSGSDVIRTLIRRAHAAVASNAMRPEVPAPIGG